MRIDRRSANTSFYSLANLRATKNLVSHILSHRKYKIIFVITAIAFAVFYMFATGIFFYSSEPISEFIPMPHFSVIWPGDVINDQTPWFIAYLNKHLIFRMSSHALLSTSLLSFLVGMNTSLFTYSFKIGRKSLDCKCNSSISGGQNKSIPMMTFAGTVPASFATFACHGAFLLPILGLPFLSPYGGLFVASSIGSLVTGLLLVSNMIRRMVV